MSSPAGAAGDERKYIDYVLGYRSASSTDSGTPTSLYRQHASAIREHYETLLRHQGVCLWETRCGDGYTYVLLHCPANRLLVEGERMQLKMPLKDCPIDSSGHGLMAWLCNASGAGACGCACLDQNEAVAASATLYAAHLDLYEGSDNVATFFRPAVRSLLVKNILSETDISELCFLTGDCIGKPSEEKVLAKRGLSFLLAKGVYDFATQLPDVYILAEESGLNSNKQIQLTKVSSSTAEMQRLAKRRVFSFRLVKCIREYYSEEIAFYFAWSAMLAQLLMVPALLGLLLFALGVALPSQDAWIGGAITGALNSSVTAVYPVKTAIDSLATTSIRNSSGDPVTALVNFYEDFLNYVHNGVDNLYTWGFGIILGFWGTLFIEAWKRQSSVLSHMWHVEEFKASEAPRPQFSGRVRKLDGIETLEYTSSAKRWAYRFLSFVVIVAMGAAALVVSIIFSDLRLKINTDLCSGSQAASVTCSLAILSTMLANIIFTLIMGWVYAKLASRLTDSENHMTETRHRNELATKLLIFSAINEYVPLYYITFFQGNVEIFRPWSILGINDDESDRCGKYSTCLPLLSLQLIMLTLAKPLWKLACKLFSWLVTLCRKNQKQSERHNGSSATYAENLSTATVSAEELLTKERSKAPMGNFTQMRYLQKVLQYGHIMLFGVSMPLAPLFVLLIHSMNHWLDFREMLQTRRRPAAQIAQDIGIWQRVMELANTVGVVTSCLLMATMTSNPLVTSEKGKLLYALVWTVLLIVAKSCISECIPDVPKFVLDARKQERYQFMKKLKEKSPLPASSAAALGLPSYPAYGAVAVAVDSDLEAAGKVGSPDTAAGGADGATGAHRANTQRIIWQKETGTGGNRLYPDVRFL